MVLPSQQWEDEVVKAVKKRVHVRQKSHTLQQQNNNKSKRRKRYTPQHCDSPNTAGKRHALKCLASLIYSLTVDRKVLINLYVNIMVPSCPDSSVSLPVSALFPVAVRGFCLLCPTTCSAMQHRWVRVSGDGFSPFTDNVSLTNHCFWLITLITEISCNGNFLLLPITLAAALIII